MTIDIPSRPDRAGRLREELQPRRGAQVLFKVHPDAHKTQIRQAVEELFEVKVLVAVNVSKVQPKPKRRGVTKGVRKGWKKAIVQVARGQEMQIFGGAQV